MINLYRKKILNFLQWNDKNGYYTDERCNLEKVPRLSFEESIKYFFGVINSDFYYTIVDNMFELSFYETIEYAKYNGFYKETCNKLSKLINNASDNYALLYKSLLKKFSSYELNILKNLLVLSYSHQTEDNIH